jgi:hypothetical protein
MDALWLSEQNHCGKITVVNPVSAGLVPIIFSEDLFHSKPSNPGDGEKMP